MENTCYFSKFVFKFAIQSFFEFIKIARGLTIFANAHVISLYIKDLFCFVIFVAAIFCTVPLLKRYKII